MDISRMPDLITPAIPFFVLSLIIEGFVVKRMKDEGRDVQGHTLKDTAASLTMGLGNLIIGLVWKGIVFAFYIALYQLTPLRMPSAPWVWVLLFLGDDFCYYWFHRVHHECRFLWAGHVRPPLEPALQPLHRPAAAVDHALHRRALLGAAGAARVQPRA